MIRTHTSWAGLGFVLLAVLLSGCTGPIAVNTRTSEDARLADYGTFRLSVAAGEGADADRDGIPLALLEREATTLIQERGYRPGDDPAEGVALRLTAKSETVVRRTWSADPGYNGYVEREREEGVLAIVAFDDVREVEVWRGVSRVRLPDSGLVVGPSRETVWMDALVELIARIPASRRE
jgi:hypothetical protein